MLKHQPFGWVKDEYKYVHIVCVHKNKIEFSPDEDDNGILFTSTMDFTSVCEKGGYTFADGTPFGIKEEQLWEKLELNKLKYLEDALKL